jgi:hypothetical protein
MINYFLCRYYPEVKCNIIKEIGDSHVRIPMCPNPYMGTIELVVEKEKVNKGHLKVEIKRLFGKTGVILATLPTGDKIEVTFSELRKEYIIDETINIMFPTSETSDVIFTLD